VNEGRTEVSEGDVNEDKSKLKEIHVYNEGKILSIEENYCQTFVI
jgi:hypothetical protein